MVKDYQKKILSLFIELELSLAQLYLWLAEKFPEEADFFRDHHAEELKHAQWIEYFKGKAEAGEILFREDKVRTYTVNSFQSHVEGIIAQAQADNLTLLKALSLAASIEESLIERKVLDHFNTDLPELQVLLQRLKNETSGHAAEIKKLWKKHAPAA
jgi:hypothetical protein